MSPHGKRRRRRRAARTGHERTLRGLETLDDQTKRARMVSIFGVETVEAAVAERQLLANIDTAAWRTLERVLAVGERLAPSKRKAFVIGQPEVIRRLLVLCVLDAEAIAVALERARA